LRDQFNRAWQALRQPGSSFKPYVYTAAIDSGLTPATIIDDDPVSYPMGNGTWWSPQDDDHSFLGPVTLRYALAQSRNVVAVKLSREVGIDKVIAYAKSMGIKDHLSPNLSLALGTSGVTPLEQASGYATLADAGVHVAASPLRLVTNADNSPVLDNLRPRGSSVVSAATAYVVTSMLESVIENGTGYPNAQIGRPAAGKTGTTSDFRDAWFVGYTPDLVAAVWMGNDDDSAMNDAYGGDIPARIWARFMRAALHGRPKQHFQFPDGDVRKITLCSGQSEVFVAGTEPYESCGGPPPAQVEAFALPPPDSAANR
jgi:penicillin-binding protein 1A